MAGWRQRRMAPTGLDDTEQIFIRRLVKRRHKLFKQYTGYQNPYTGALIAGRMGFTRASLSHWECGWCGLQSFEAWRRWAQMLGGKFTVTLKFPDDE